MERVGGTLRCTVDGEAIRCQGEFTYRPSVPKRTAVLGTNGVVGCTEEPQVPFVEGAVTDSASTSLDKLFNIFDATIQLDLINGKSFMLRGGFYAGSAEVKTGQGEINVRFEGETGEEV